MSRENVEVVRALFAAYATGEVEAVISAAAADIEIRPGLVGSLEGTVYRGREGFGRFLADVDAAWEEWKIDIDELRDLNDTVLALGRVRARARDGMTLEAGAGWIFVMRDGKIASFRSFTTQAEALEAAGLRE
jgi:ketosteroid isomerase-like protein